MEWLSSRRQFLMDVSSRKTIGRPVPKLILKISLASQYLLRFRVRIYLLMIKPIETQPNACRNNF